MPILGRARSGPAVRRRLVIAHQQNPKAVRLPEEASQFSQGAIYRPGEGVGPSEFGESLRGDELEEKAGRTRGKARKVNGEDTVILEEQHRQGRRRFERDKWGVGLRARVPSPPRGYRPPAVGL